MWYSGGGTLSYTVSDNAAWLAVSPATGTSTGEHDIITPTANHAGLATGTFAAGYASDAECDDALFCNEAETCVNGAGQAGTSTPKHDVAKAAVNSQGVAGATTNAMVAPASRICYTVVGQQWPSIRFGTAGETELQTQ